MHQAESHADLLREWSARNEHLSRVCPGTRRIVPGMSKEICRMKTSLLLIFSQEGLLLLLARRDRAELLTPVGRGRETPTNAFMRSQVFPIAIGSLLCTSQKRGEV